MIIKVKIDVTKIEKARLFAGKNGAKYLDITLLENRDGQVGQYGDHGMVIQDVSKEERQSGVKGKILGNFKILEKNAPPAPPSTPAASEPPIDGDDVPF